jgi:hypothetical protein
MKKAFIHTFFVVLTALSQALVWAEGTPTTEGNMVPVWRLRDLDGKAIGSDDFKGQGEVALFLNKIPPGMPYFPTVSVRSRY